uniref:Uncharacterized protein n=1 Tax=Rhizophora mucronata TaxID=61149 RepID=A0A2P2PDJ7_RHIMU
MKQSHSSLSKFLQDQYRTGLSISLPLQARSLYISVTTHITNWKPPMLLKFA